MSLKKHHANISIVLNWYVTKFSRDLCLPSLPAIALALHTQNRYVKYTVSFYFLGMGISRFLFTPLSDMFGRRLIILYSLPIFVIGSALCAISPDIVWFTIGRSLQALGIGCVTAIGWAMIGDVYGADGSTKAMAYLSAFAMWAPAIASTLGGHLQQWFGWHASFIFLAVGGALLYLQTLFGLKETNEYLQPKEKIVKQILKNYALLVVESEYWRYILTFSMTFAGTTIYYANAPFIFINQLNIPAHIYGYFAFGTVAGLIAGKFLAIHTVEKYSVDATLFLGLIISAIAGFILIVLAYSVPPTVVTVLGPSLLYFMGNGVMSPTTKSGTVGLLPGTAGTAAALFGLIQGLAAFCAGLISTHIHGGSDMSLGIMFFSLSSLGLLAMFIFRPNADKAEQNT